MILDIIGAVSCVVLLIFRAYCSSCDEYEKEKQYRDEINDLKERLYNLENHK